MALFKEYLIEKIIIGEKTQTRRLRKKGDGLFIVDDKKTILLNVNANNERIKYQVGRNYAIQYGRGKPCRWWMTESYLGNPELMPYEQFLQMSNYPTPWEWILEDEGWKKLRYTITDIRSVDVRNISLKNSIAEGFESQIGFWKVWAKFYDPAAHNYLKDFHRYSDDIESAYKYLLMSPDKLYHAWALDFEVFHG